MQQSIAWANWMTH